MSNVTFTAEEKTLLLLYQENNCKETMKNLRQMKQVLLPEETSLQKLTDSVLEKLQLLSEEEFAALDFFSDFDL